MKALLVFIGGGLGAVARYLLQSLAVALIPGAFPWGTFAVNLSGSFLLGLLFGYGTAVHLRPEWRLLLATGFLGGYTTFSSWQLESWVLVTEGQWRLAFGNLLGSLLLGFAALLAGFLLGERL